MASINSLLSRDLMRLREYPKKLKRSTRTNRTTDIRTNLRKGLFMNIARVSYRNEKSPV
jgi:hypothetical protein